jgi:hypothetical protein
VLFGEGWKGKSAASETLAEWMMPASRYIGLRHGPHRDRCCQAVGTDMTYSGSSKQNFL